MHVLTFTGQVKSRKVVQLFCIFAVFA